MPIIVPPAHVESLPFPSMADQLNGTYNSKAYAWAERHPFVAYAMSGQADATYQNALYVKDRADNLDTAAAQIVANIDAALQAAQTATNAASDAIDSADAAAASASAAAASAGSINTAYLLNRANHTGTQPVASIIGAGSVPLLNAANTWLEPQKMNLAPKGGTLLTVQGQADSVITQVGLGYAKGASAVPLACLDFYASKEIRNAQGQYPDYLRIGTEGTVHVIAAGTGNVTGGANGSHPIDVQVNGESIQTFYAGQINHNKPTFSNGARVLRGQSHSAYVDTSPTTWNRLLLRRATNAPWMIEGILSMPGVHWAAKIRFGGTTSSVWSPSFKFELLGSYAYYNMIPYQFRVVTSSVNEFVALDFRFVGGSGQNQWVHFETLLNYGSSAGERAEVWLGTKAGPPTQAAEAAHIMQIGTASSLTYREVDFMASQSNASVIQGDGIRTSVSVVRTWPTA